MYNLKKRCYEFKILKFMPKPFYRLPVRDVAVHALKAHRAIGGVAPFIQSFITLTVDGGQRLT